MDKLKQVLDVVLEQGERCVQAPEEHEDCICTVCAILEVMEPLVEPGRHNDRPAWLFVDLLEGSYVSALLAWRKPIASER